MHTCLLITPDEISWTRGALIDAQATDRVLKAVIAWQLAWPANGWPSYHFKKKHHIGLYSGAWLSSCWYSPVEEGVLGGRAQQACHSSCQPGLYGGLVAGR
jgi:hypothetical protein